MGKHSRTLTAVSLFMLCSTQIAHADPPSRLKKESEPCATLCSKGEKLLEEYKLDEAVKTFRLALKADRRCARAHIGISGCYREGHNPEDALIEANKAVELAPAQSESYVARARAYDGLRDYKRCLVETNRALKLNPNSPWALILRSKSGYAVDALSRREETDDERRLNDLKRACEIAPKLPEAHAALGEAYGILGRYKEGAAALTKAIALRPNNKIYYELRSTQYAGMRQYDKALEDLSSVIRLHPKFPRAYNERAQHYEHLGKFDKAFEDYTKSLELDGSRHHIRYQRAMLAEKIGKYKESIGDYTLLLGINPKDDEMIAGRAGAYFKAGMLDKALADYSRAIELSPESLYYEGRSRVYRKLGKPDLANKDLQQASKRK